MNSIQKQNSPIEIEDYESFLVTFEKNLLEAFDINQLELLMKKLQFLGLNFDPFQSELNNECKQIMDQMDLTIHMRNPYLATNILLRLLDKTEERLNNLKQ